MIPGIFAVGTGLVNFFEKSSIYNERRNQLDDYASRLNELMLTRDEATERIDAVSDAFNPAIVADLNNQAIGNSISGVLNPIAYSQLIPKKAEAVLNERNRIDEYNANLEAKIAETKLMDIPKPGFWDFLSGGIQGYGAGVQVESILDESALRSERMKLLKDTLLNPVTSDTNFNFLDYEFTIPELGKPNLSWGRKNKTPFHF